MSNCTDCIPQIPDPCKGKRTWTSCVLSQDPIPSLGVLANEQLNITLERLGLLIQSCCGGLSTTIPNWEEIAYLGGSLVFHKNAIWRSEENDNETEPDKTNSSWTMLADITKPTMVIQIQQPEVDGLELVIPTDEKTIQYIINGQFVEQGQEQVFEITPTQTSEYYRKDIVVGYVDGTIELIEGIESETEVIDPTIPDGAILLTSYVIVGNQIIEFEAPPTEEYIPKKSEGWIRYIGSPPFGEAIYGIGDWNGIHLDYPNSPVIVAGLTRNNTTLRPWAGATIYFKNTSVHPVTLKHLSTNVNAKIKFDFPDGKDLILRKEDGVAMFKLSNYGLDGTATAHHVNSRHKPLKRYNAVYSLIDSQPEILNCPELNIKIALTKMESIIRLTVSKISLDGDYVYDLTAVNMFDTSEKSGQDGAVVNSLDPLAHYLLTVNDHQESDNLIKFVISRVSDNETWHGTVVTSNNGDRAKILITQEVVGS